MPLFSTRCSTCTQSCSALSASARSPVPSGELSSTTSTRNPSGAARSSTSPAACTIARTLSASLYVGRISQGSPDIGRRTLARAPTLMPVPAPELSNAAIADALQELGDLYELDGGNVHRV